MTGGASTEQRLGDESTLVEDAFVFTAMRSAGATWYGPGLYGRHTACGQTLRPATIGVAHRTLPCGTAVKFLYRGRSIVARVIDRGPYSTATPGTSPTAPAGARLRRREPGPLRDRPPYARIVGTGGETAASAGTLFASNAGPLREEQRHVVVFTRACR